ncbi:MAG: hypothetical protein ACHQFX_17410 [Chitinophagales bacterium]
MYSVTLDSQKLYELYGGSYDDVRFILSNYLDKHDDIVNSFHEAFISGIEPLIKCTHRYSSSFTYIGLSQVTEECRNFEQECKMASDTMELKPGFERLLNIIEQGSVLVKQELTRVKRA